MSEIQKHTEEDDTFQRDLASRAKKVALGIGVGTITAGAIGWGIGASVQNETGPSTVQEASNVEHEALVFNASQVIGEIDIDEDETLIDTAKAIIEARVGDEYNDIKKRIYGPLMESAQQYNPQPGDTFYVVEVDVNPEANDGVEYFVADPEHVVSTGTDSLPSPIIADGSQPN